MSRIQIAKRFLHFYKNADTIYNIHSPFVYDLAQAVLEDNRHFYAFSMIEPLRQMHLHNHNLIEVEDFGAGSLVNNNKQRKVSSIAKSAVSSPARSRLLFRLVNHLHPKTLLELGTSLGISALYQKAAAQKARMITLEGSPNIAHLANATFKAYEVPLNIELRLGEFGKTLQLALRDLQKVDFVFFDGNHQKKATLDYFEQCLAYAHENTVFVFDDIYWSDEMQAAWESIKQHSKVCLSVDFFHLGLVFFRKEHKNKAHFKVVSSNWKPWSMGFF